MKSFSLVLQFSLLLLSLSPGLVRAETVVIGSKQFTESVIVSEILRRSLENEGLSVNHERELGGTQIIWKALLAGEIHAYPEYLGTITGEIVPELEGRSLDRIRTELEKKGIAVSDPLGFQNSYALGMRREKAAELGIRSISDLAGHSNLRFGFSEEFLERRDGWPSLMIHYSLHHEEVRGMEHHLAYQGLVSGQIDLVDLYSTDAEIEKYDLVLLEDDLSYFPDYQAVILYNPKHVPVEAIKRIAGKIDNSMMVAMNSSVQIQGESDEQVAARFVRTRLGIDAPEVEQNAWKRWLDRLFRTTREHLFLVLVSLSMAILIAIPLGVLAYRVPSTSGPILATVSTIQTIPSLALLVFMVPLIGLGEAPAIIAMFLYSLLPIVRNTHSGLSQIPQNLHDSAIALGLSSGQRLWKIELPLCAPSILAGIKTSAVINVGTATIGALVGAGGYGESILTGIRLDNRTMILTGAVPAALLALLVQQSFRYFEPRQQK